MSYQDLKSAFHRGDVDEELLYQERFSSDAAVKLDISIGSDQGFFIMAPEIYESTIRVAKADKELLRLSNCLPGKAIEQFTINNLIDEIVLTNEIEGVRSTRREISDVLDSLADNDSKKRFHGLVNKYLMLNSGQWDAIACPEDVRKLYDELVLTEVLEEAPGNAPDGVLFRKDSVSIYDGANREVHRGLMPEHAIIVALDKSIQFLNSSTRADDLARIAAFHFLFGYIHPFYDGNGRTNRFISSQHLSNCCEPLAGYNLSFTIKERLVEYNNAFALCEHPLSKGDITPFVIVFSSIVAESLERICGVLSEKRSSLEYYSGVLDSLFSLREKADPRLKDLAFLFVQASLFADRGISIAEIGDDFHVSRGTVYKMIQQTSDIVPLVKERQHRQVRYRADLDKLNLQGTKRLG